MKTLSLTFLALSVAAVSASGAPRTEILKSESGATFVHQIDADANGNDVFKDPAGTTWLTSIEPEFRTPAVYGATVDQAEARCEKLGARLPTTDEFQQLVRFTKNKDGDFSPCAVGSKNEERDCKYLYPAAFGNGNSWAWTAPKDSGANQIYGGYGMTGYYGSYRELALPIILMCVIPQTSKKKCRSVAIKEAFAQLVAGYGAPDNGGTTGDANATEVLPNIFKVTLSKIKSNPYWYNLPRTKTYLINVGVGKNGSCTPFSTYSAETEYGPED